MISDRAIFVAKSLLGVRSVVDRLAINPVNRPDSAIRKDIEAALKAGPISSLYKIGIAVDRASARLSGTVPSLEEKRFIVKFEKYSVKQGFELSTSSRRSFCRSTVLLRSVNMQRAQHLHTVPE